MSRHTTRLWWEIGLTVAVVVITVAVLLVRGLTSRQDTSSAPPTVPPDTTSSTAPSTAAPVLAVKIDNVRAARPATGLGTADVVYVEPVEGGLTRLLAIYHGEPPAVIGPVRSARRTDLEVLGQYGKPVLAYSGAAPELLPALHAANLVNASPSKVPDAYYRNANRPAPHNLTCTRSVFRATRSPRSSRCSSSAPLPRSVRSARDTTSRFRRPGSASRGRLRQDGGWCRWTASR